MSYLIFESSALILIVNSQRPCSCILGKYKIERYHKVLEDLYEKYGPLVRQDLGNGTIIHIFDPEDIRTVYINEGTMPYVVPLQETAQLYRQTRNMSLGLGNV